MTTHAVRVLCIGGSTRPNSSSEKAIRVAAAAAEKAGATVELIVSRDLILPVYDTETPERTPAALRFLDAVRAADALLVASPGYHGAMSGMIKNALDYLEDTNRDDRVYLDGIPVGCIAVAHGWQATVSTLHSIRTVVHALRGWPSPLGGTVNASGPVFGPDGACLDDAARFQLETIAAQVVEFATLRRSALAPA
jgi:FMN reductase